MLAGGLRSLLEGSGRLLAMMRVIMTGGQIQFALKFFFRLSHVRRRFNRKKYSTVQYLVAAHQSGCGRVSGRMASSATRPGGARKQTSSYCEAAAR